jgi:hypothetical protein
VVKIQFSNFSLQKKRENIEKKIQSQKKGKLREKNKVEKIKRKYKRNKKCNLIFCVFLIKFIIIF